MQIEIRKTSSIKPYPGNPRTIGAEAIARVAKSIESYGFRQPIVVDAEGAIIVGHVRFLAAKKLKFKEVPVHVATDLSPEKVRGYRLADNRVAEYSEWDFDALKVELADLEEAGYDLVAGALDDFDIHEIDTDGDERGGASKEIARNKLKDKFMVPPFSVLNAREGWWQERKNAWIALGIKSELGRGESGAAFNCGKPSDLGKDMGNAKK